MPSTTHQRAPATGNSPPASLAGLRVLIIDDDPDWTEALGELLVTRGCSVMSARDGAAALDAVAHESPQAILLDVGLPDMSGHDVARSVRATGAPATPLLIALSGYDTTDAMQASLDAGCADYLVKPIDVPRLLALLRRAAGA